MEYVGPPDDPDAHQPEPPECKFFILLLRILPPHPPPSSWLSGLEIRYGIRSQCVSYTDMSFCRDTGGQI